VLAAGMAGVFGALSLPGGTAEASASHGRLDQLRLVNLSHVNDPATTNVFPGDPAFELETIATVPEDGYFLQFVREGEHTGTHWGAPGHFNEGALLADQMDIADLFLPAVKIDVRRKVADNADYGVTIDDIKAWERRHGRIPDESMVVLQTGWESRWGTPAFPNQAFRVGRTAYGVQFHVEVTEQMAREWAGVPAYAEYADRVLGAGGIDRLMADFDAARERMLDVGRRMFERWVEIAVAVPR